MPRATSPGFASDPHPDIASRLVLRHGTPAQRHAVLQDTAVMWSGQLTADQYVGLSELADLDEYGSQNMTFLVLVDREDDKIYASAEVWIRSAFTVLPGQMQVAEERAAALHHLYVPPQARGHGLGRLFLRELFKWIDGKAELVYGFAQAGEGVFRNTSAYDRSGDALTPTDARWTSRMLCVCPPYAVTQYGGRLQVTPITIDDLPAIISSDDAQLKLQLLSSGPVDHPRTAIPINLAHYRMLTNLDDYRSRMNGTEPLTTVGWTVGKVGESGFAYMLIRPMLIEPSLSVMRSCTPTSEHMAALLSAAAAYAQQHGLTKCVVSFSAAHALRIRCYGDTASKKINAAGLIDHKSMLETTGVQDLCEEDPRCGMLRLHQDDQTCDWLGIQMFTASSPMGGTPQRVLSNRP